LAYIQSIPQTVPLCAASQAVHCKDDPDWDYYQRWLLALERLALASNLLDPTELDQRTAEFLARDNPTKS
jgi:hypothetical protein